MTASSTLLGVTATSDAPGYRAATRTMTQFHIAAW
jgi:hypothetical protein